MPTAKADYQLLEREYVTGGDDVTYRELGRRYSISFSAVAEQGRKRDWDHKRAAYRDLVNRRTTDGLAERMAAERVQIRSEAILVLRASLRSYSQQLAAGTITFQPKDSTLIVRELMTLLGEPTARTETTVFGITVDANSPINPDLLLRLGELARRRLAGGDVEDPARPLLEGSGPH